MATDSNVEQIKLKNPPKKLKSKVWEHFGFREGQETDKATCKICFTDVSYPKSGSTSNLMQHMKRKHDVDLFGKHDMPSSSKRSVCNLPANQLKLTEMKGKVTAERSQTISTAIAGYLACDMRPYSTVQNEGFRNMIHVLEPRYKLPSRTHFSEKVIPALWKKVEDRVRKRLQIADSIAITTDSWTSRATENYVAVTAHFINSNWQVENYTLETKLFSDSHTAENLASGLHDTVTSWQLERNGKGPAISTDNASNIVRAVKDSGLSPHVGCFAHTLNLATQRGLKVSQVDRLLGRVRRVVTFFHKSTSATSILKVMQETLDLPNHKLLMDVSTRWNSSFDMCERYLEQQAAVYATLIEVKKSVKDIVTLSESDVQNIEEVIKILKPLKTVTTLMCSQKHPTVSLIHPLKEMLLRQLEVLPSDNMLVSDIKTAISNDLKPRYTDENILGFLLQASALDPRFKSLPYLDDRSRCAVYDNIQSAAELLQSDSSCQNVTVKSEPDETPTSSQATMDVPVLPSLSTLGEGEPPLKVKKETEDSDCKSNSCALADLFGDVFVTKVEPAKSSVDRVRAELVSYKEEACLPLNSDVSNPLLWWKEKEDKYPLRSRYAKQLLCVPATSVASERVFSTAGDVVTAQRACLTGDQVNMLVFLKQNIIIPDDLL